tara:strand:- start:633 stop:839 length:207 start_codon:yes stop_codon:yes gene_type:complete
MLKPLLLELSIREARQLGKHNNSLKLQNFFKTAFAQALNYRIIDIYKIDDFNQEFHEGNIPFISNKHF